MTVCEVCRTWVELSHPHMGVETCHECRIRQITETVEQHLSFEEAEEWIREGIELEAEISHAFAAVLAVISEE